MRGAFLTMIAGEGYLQGCLVFHRIRIHHDILDEPRVALCPNSGSDYSYRAALPRVESTTERLT